MIPFFEGLNEMVPNDILLIGGVYFESRQFPALWRGGGAEMHFSVSYIVFMVLDYVLICIFLTLNSFF